MTPYRNPGSVDPTITDLLRGAEALDRLREHWSQTDAEWRAALAWLHRSWAGERGEVRA